METKKLISVAVVLASVACMLVIVVFVSMYVPNFTKPSLLQSMYNGGIKGFEHNKISSSEVYFLIELPSEIKQELVVSIQKLGRKEYAQGFEESEKVVVSVSRPDAGSLSDVNFTYYSIIKDEAGSWCVGEYIVNGSWLPNKSVARFLIQNYLQ